MSGRRDDPAGGLLLATVALSLAVTVLLSKVAVGPGALHHLGTTVVGWLRALVPFGGAAIGLLVGVLVLRWWLVGRTLRSRVSFALVPSDGFDPSLDAVQAFAAQLARTRRVVGGWWTAPASAVRIRITPDQDGMVGYQLEIPQRAQSALRAACSLYADAQLDQRPDIAPISSNTSRPRGRAGRRVRVVRAELVLARSSAEPLADRGLDPDPLQSIAASLDGLEQRLGESASVLLDLQPVTPGRRRRLRSRMLRQARRRSTSTPSRSLGEILRGDRAARRVRDPADLVARRSETTALQGKLGSPAPLFQMQLLLEARLTSTARAKARLEALLSCFDAFAGENHLTASGVRVLGLWFLGSDMPGRRCGFDRRARTGRFAPARRSVVTAGEIAGLLKPPTVNCQAANVQRSGGVVAPPPAGLPAFTGQRDLIPLGRVTGHQGERLAGVRVSETIFSYMAGRSRYGKTETAIGQFVHLTRTGQGGMFLDPHADAIAEIKSYLTDPAIRDRVVEIDLSDLAGRHGQPGWNPFDVTGRPAWEAGERVEAVVDALAAALGWDERNTRALNLATQAAQAMVELALRLPAGLAPTVFQIPTLLSNETWRERILPFVSPATRQFFTDRFPRLPAEAITPVTNIVDRLRAARPVAALLGSPVSTFDARAAMDQGQIVLACPGSGGTRDRLVANLLVYEVLHAIKARASTPPEKRRPFWIFLDELQTYDGPNLPALLEQSAKYGGRAALFNQNPERLTDATLNAVTTNRSHLSTTAVNAKAAGLLAREWGGEPAPATITQLARYTYLASITLGDRTSKPFLVHGVRTRELHADAHHPELVSELEAAIDHNTARQPVDQVLANLDHHDDRIVGWLTQQRRNHPVAGDPGRQENPGSSDVVKPRAVTIPKLPSNEGQLL